MSLPPVLVKLPFFFFLFQGGFNTSFFWLFLFIGLWIFLLLLLLLLLPLIPFLFWPFVVIGRGSLAVAVLNSADFITDFRSIATFDIRSNLCYIMKAEGK